MFLVQLLRKAKQSIGGVQDESVRISKPIQHFKQ